MTNFLIGFVAGIFSCAVALAIVCWKVLNKQGGWW